MKLAHEGHIGIVKCKDRLRGKVWWPNIDQDVSDLIAKCHSCQTTSLSKQPAPMKIIPMPALPWSSVAVDLCGPFPTGETLLVLVDYYSRFPFVEIIKNTTSKTIIAKLFEIFSVHGLPETLTSDNGGQFTSDEFELFLKINGIHHNKTTPLWPQANGQVERINRVIKKAIQAAVNDGLNWRNELNTFLLSYRNTPHCTTGETPSFLLFSRNIRDKLPSIPHEINNRRHQEAVSKNNVNKEKMKQYCDLKRRAKNDDINVDDVVLLKHTGMKDKLTSTWSTYPCEVIKVNGTAVVVKRRRDGKIFTRNISMVKKYIQDSDSSDDTDNTLTTNDVDNHENELPFVVNARPTRIRNPPIRFGEAYTH